VSSRLPGSTNSLTVTSGSFSREVDRRSLSVVEIRNSFGLVGQTQHGNSTRGHCATEQNPKRDNSRIENRHCTDKGHYPDDDADDTETCPDQYFHLRSVFLIAEKSHARDEPQGLAVARMSFTMGHQSRQSARANHWEPLSQANAQVDNKA
jgi:hypothetical protein